MTKQTAGATAPITTNGNGSLKDRALLVDLSIGGWRTGMKDKKVGDKVIKENNANARAGHFQKNLLPFDSSEYNAIKQAERDAREFFWQETSPWNDKGIRILLGSNFVNFTNGMREKQAAYDNAVSHFLPRYPELVKRAALPKPDGLGDMFNEKDYPDHATLKLQFYFRVKRMPIPDSADFRLNLSSDQIDGLKTSYEDDLRSNVEMASRDVFDRLYQVVKKASDDLGDSKKSIHKALFENAREVCSVLPRLFGANSPELAEMISQVEKKLGQADPDIVRKSKRVRSSLASDVSEIEKKMSQFMTPQV